jgi:recombination protein RecT
MQNPIVALKSTLNHPSVYEQFANCLGDKTPLFMASIIDVVASDQMIQKADPKTVIREALKAATLNLPINKSLGFAYLVPYKGQAQMQIGYKGLIQLAQRTGKYRHINAGPVFAGEMKGMDKLTGAIDLSGAKTSDDVIGYFAYIELMNGFKKTEYWPKEQVVEHAKRYSQAFKSKFSPWSTEFDKMATKTVLKSLLSTYGIMTVEMASAVDQDNATTVLPNAQAEMDAHANSEFIDIDPPKQTTPPDTDMPADEQQEIMAAEAAEAAQQQAQYAEQAPY